VSNGNDRKNDNYISRDVFFSVLFMRSSYGCFLRRSADLALLFYPYRPPCPTFTRQCPNTGGTIILSMFYCIYLVTQFVWEHCRKCFSSL